MKLFTQLEDKRWTCCAACQRLHPRGEFPSFELEYSPWRRSCRWWSGIVNLCPCIAITPRDRTHVGEYLRGSRKSLNLVDKGSWRMASSVSYICATPTHPFRWKLHFPLEKKIFLMVYAEYKVPCAALTRDMESVYFCAHGDLRGCLLSRLCHSPSRVCNWCRTLGVKSTSPDVPDLVLAQATRNLGEIKYPLYPDVDSEWERQRRDEWLYFQLLGINRLS